MARARRTPGGNQGTQPQGPFNRQNFQYEVASELGLGNTNLTDEQIQQMEGTLHGPSRGGGNTGGGTTGTGTTRGTGGYMTSDTGGKAGGGGTTATPGAGGGTAGTTGGQQGGANAGQTGNTGGTGNTGNRRR